MNIFENNYCSRCMKPISIEEKCPYCGYRETDTVKKYFIDEGTLFCDGRYELGAVYREDTEFIYYSAWDYQKKNPVIIKEYFPKNMAFRNTTNGDEVLVLNEHQDNFRNIVEQLLSTSALAFKRNNTVYLIENHPEGNF